MTGACPLVLVPGTWQYGGSQADTAQWWAPGSPFWMAAKAQGLTLLGEHDPFEWSSSLSGLPVRPWADAKAAGQALRWFALSHGVREIDVVSHSHGGAAAVFAASRSVRGFRVRTLITAGMPVREDLRTIYQRARANVAWWVHIRGGRRDWWQLAGELFDGHLGWRRDCAYALQNIAVADSDHAGLVDHARWTAQDWWRFLR